MSVSLYTPAKPVPSGWTVVDMPDVGAIQQVEFRIYDANGVTTSPFSLNSQVQQWPGADRWEADVSLPPMPRKSASAWIAWLAALRGMACVFQLADPSQLTPQGSASGTPVINGDQAAMITQINTKGWTANATGVLQPGDQLQLNWRLHMVAGTEEISADANGNATIPIWPSLREPVTDAQEIILENPSGIFRLADNTRGWSVNEAHMFGISFKCIEAR